MIYVTPALHIKISFIFSFDLFLAIAFGGWGGLFKLSLKGAVA